MTKTLPPLDIDISFAPFGDPVLVVLWNEQVLAQRLAANAAHTKASIIARLLANGASDNKNSGSIFHFRLMGDLQSARESFLAEQRWVFGTTPEMEQEVAAQHRDPVAESFILTRITMSVVDYADARFFYF